MRKIAVIGSPGAGKSTFSKHLAERLGLPLIHLDANFWKSGWVETPKTEWDVKMQQLTSGESWIIDGNYGRTLDIRLQEADTVIFLKLSRWICIWRVFKRRVRHWGKSRQDVGPNCIERFDRDFLEFIRYIWNFPKQNTSEIFRKLENHHSRLQVNILHSPTEVADFLHRITPII